MAGTIELSQWRKNVRGLVGDADYDLTLIDQAINWAMNDLHNSSRIRYMETEDDLYPSAGDTTVDFPDDFQTLINLTLLVPQVIALTRNYVGYNEFVAQYPGYTVQAPAQINEWTDFANAMRFSAPSKTNAQLHIEYLRRATIMVADDDTTDLPDNYEELGSKAALARIMEINEDYAEASQERNNYADLQTTFIRNEGRGQVKVGPSIMKSNRGRAGGRGAWRADRDFE
jgi:hypothetical protein